MAKNLKPVVEQRQTGKNRIPESAFDNKLTKNFRPPSPLNQKIEWSFSFKYFKQIDNFGLSGLDPKWFISVIERLKDLCNMEVESFLNSHLIRGRHRFHEINWDLENVPIKRKAFTWIDPEIIRNSEEIPFYQFQVSKALGRVVGFFNENSDIFYIILLDPKHNIQPSKYSDYKIRSTETESCQYTSILYEIDSLKRLTKKCDDCHIVNGLHNIHSNTFFTNGVLFFLADDYLEVLKTRLESKTTLSEIIELGLISE